jgi:hypothetical protein
MGFSSGYSQYDRAKEDREYKERLEKQKRQDIEDIDEEINWAYSRMRIIEAYLEEAIERNEVMLSDRDSKRIDKALVVTRTGLKMLKKVVKSRAPLLDTAAWRSETRVTQ